MSTNPIQRGGRHEAYVDKARTVRRARMRYGVFVVATLLALCAVPAMPLLLIANGKKGGAVFAMAWLALCVAAAILLWASDRARRELAAAIAGSGLCRACGYDLRGSPGRRCPECGAAGRPSSE